MNLKELFGQEPKKDQMYKFTCQRYVDDYQVPIKVEYIDSFEELQVAVDEIKTQGPLLHPCVKEVQEDEYPYWTGATPSPRTCAWGNSAVNSVMHGE